MKPSPYQEAIFQFIRNSERNLIVQAVAGSGKTTTLRILSEQLDPSLRIVALCFNKLNAEQFQEKLPSYVVASTMHSLGYRIIRDNFHGCKVDQNKQFRIMRDVWGNPRDRSMATARLCQQIQQLLPMCLYTMTNPMDTDAFLDMVDEYGLDIEDDILEETQYGIEEQIRLAREDRTAVSFDDMIDFVTHFQLQNSDRYDIILGDEVQDWNRQQACFVELLAGKPGDNDDPMDVMLQPNALDDLLGLASAAPKEKTTRPTRSRVVLVGDRRQSIYAFRGADQRSMENLKAAFQCHELPLSVCYRCPKSVIRAAQDIVGKTGILWHDGAEEGEVLSYAPAQEVEMLMELPDGAMVMCRCNAPLVEGALALISRGRKATIRGRDIGANLRKIVLDVAKKHKVDLINDFLPALRTWADGEIRAKLADERISAAQLVEDKYLCICICVLSSGCTSVSELANSIERLFDNDQGEGIIFSSGHRAKGLEADVAVIWDPSLVPHPMCEKSRNPSAATEQELNLLYVMTTRAMKTLIYQHRERNPRDSSFKALADAYGGKVVPPPTPHESPVLGAPRAKNDVEIDL